MIRFRRLTMELSASAFIIAGFIVALLPSALSTAPGGALVSFQATHRILFVAVIIVPSTLVGIWVGLVLWVLSFRRWVSLDELVQLIRGPGFPLFSRIAERIVRWAYSLGR